MIIDSNVIIYSIRPEYRQLQAYLLKHSNVLQVSAITRLEVVGFYKLAEEEKEQFEQFFTTILILPITDEVITEAIRLRQQRKRSLADSLIAATGILYKLPVLTNNVADFSDIEGLQIIPLSDILNT
ncbi:type II toxin-antitoxin system VapC family toxin [Spirosoma panaciterrae]|uniref:type II toxin-antitoxin system VapC family toxin n=1 Tax=Spirosoma panaciterrae TaxID=496058 RepID=UPI00035F7797|nr:type II toxin-antitoxin system VapC family toxin [Spirosoma panaciterrae]